jgi:hypothetical protein
MFEKPTTNFLKRVIERPRPPVNWPTTQHSAVLQTLGR